MSISNILIKKLCITKLSFQLSTSYNSITLHNLHVTLESPEIILLEKQTTLKNQTIELLIREIEIGIERETIEIVHEMLEELKKQKDSLAKHISNPIYKSLLID